MTKKINMNTWQSTLIPSTSSFRKALEIIDASSLQIGLVVDNQNRLLGMITDGTIRRAILNGFLMENNVTKVMFTNFVYASLSDSSKNILAMMESKRVRHIPVLDNNGIVYGLKIFKELIKTNRKENIVVLMAGGLGTRLYPLTKKHPKPLLEVGSKPILETILNGFIEQGFYQFYISVNYCSEMIKDYFKDGSKWGVKISYLEETKALGTAGALSLLPQCSKYPFIVMNGDLLTKIDFEKLLEFHVDHKSYGTMCVRQYDYQIPYGVIKFDGVNLLDIDEKPAHKCFVNAGIYVLSPESLAFIPTDHFFDMPSLFKVFKKQNKNITIFPIREYWIDIGQIKDYERAKGEYSLYFKNSY